MPWNVIVFRALLASVAVYALARGGAPERIAAVLFVVAATASDLIRPDWAHRYATTDPVILVDLALLLSLIALYYRADRIWPKWCVAAHMITTVGHGVRLLDPTLIRAAYKMLMVFSGYAVVLILAAGVYRHRRRAMRQGADNDWSSF